MQLALYQTLIYTYIDCNACSGSGAVTSSHAALQHLLHNLCCDWQASINLGSLCSIIISPAIQLDGTQWASWHCGASQRKFPVSRQGGCFLLQWIFYGGTCQYNTEHCVIDETYATSDLALCQDDMDAKTKRLILRAHFSPTCTYGMARVQINVASFVTLPAIGTQWGKCKDGLFPLSSEFFWKSNRWLFTNCSCKLQGDYFIHYSDKH